MNKLEQDYKTIKSVMRGENSLIQKAYDLQAKVECAVENGDCKAEKFFTNKIETFVSENPSLKVHMSFLAEYLGA